ncbi:nitrogen fixation protein NifM [Corallincola luteus]|uniref:peptidylprolyl isomerase n=1 Tax=Corallincola luteus TaxID=1775177 RepID=A0ABY2AM72_9GAMM|nr:nitrogen fixation protein NifM [Corallincola luteus]TCI02411.1 nitrogen fixation protein NifM [Corallincola luteus]
MSNVPHAYLLMKASLAQFGLNLQQLKPEQLAQAERAAVNAQQLQQRVLNSSEASKVVIGASQVEQAISELQSRYPQVEEFYDSLTVNGLDLPQLRQALRDEIHSETVLDYICKDLPDLSQEQALAYYDKQPEKFSQPERRRVSHILLTINDEFPENTAEQALARITELAQKITTDNFVHLAKRYSECPSAMRGGELGFSHQGQLYPELDQVLFGMSANDISAPIQSEIGYHLIWCHEIMPAHTVSFAQAYPQINQAHMKRARVAKQKQWLAELVVANREQTQRDKVLS